MHTRIVQLSDIHIGSPYSFRYRPACLTNFKQAMKQIQSLKPQPEAIVISGDLTRDGETHIFELKKLKELLQDYSYDFYCLPGNHDIGGRFEPGVFETINESKIDGYLSVFMDDKFELLVNDVRIIGFNSFLMGTNFKREQEQWVWLEKKAKEKSLSWQHQVWFMHSLPFRKEPFETESSDREKDYAGWYLYFDLDRQHRLMQILIDNGIQVIACGHSHHYVDRIVDGIRHINCPSSAFCHKDSNLGFLVYDFFDKNIDVKLHILDVVSKEEPYGRNGHIPIGERDYSLAWERSPETSEEIEKLIRSKQ